MADLKFTWNNQINGDIVFTAIGTVGGTADDWKNYSQRLVNITNPNPSISIGVLPLTYGFYNSTLVHDVASSTGAGKDSFRGWYVPQNTTKRVARKSPSEISATGQDGALNFYLGTQSNAWELAAHGTSYDEALTNLLTTNWSLGCKWDDTQASELNMTMDTGIWVYAYGSTDTIRVEISDEIADDFGPGGGSGPGGFL